MAAPELSKVLEHLCNVLIQEDVAGMPDGDLLKRYLKQRDQAAFEVLVRRHGPMVMGVCRRVLRNLHDAEDAFQATFLVLVRKASSLRSPKLLSNWLYGVAYRTAQEARRAVRKRRTKEARAVPKSEVPEYAFTELRDLLDQALERLPEKYRAPLVLCDLEGATGKEAARHLALPEGTVASRLARGRAMLAKRLARQGLVLSSGSLAVTLAQEAASACVPASLRISTVKAATWFAAGHAATAGPISVEVAALTEGVLTAMFLSKFKVTMAVLLMVLALATGTGFVLSQASSPDAPDVKPPAADREIQEKNPAAPAEAPKEKVTASAGEVGQAYMSNMALADEKFTGKRVAVTGLVYLISGGEALYGDAMTTKVPKPRYYLEMSAFATKSSPGAANDGKPIRLLKLEFTSDDRKQLAKLRPNQQVTVEGEPYLSGQEPRTIRFQNCKLIDPPVDGARTRPTNREDRR